MRFGERVAIVTFAFAIIVILSMVDSLALFQTHVKPARYRITENSPKWMPDKVLIRCEGWAEDTASRLILVRFGDGLPPVYRCLRGSEV